MERRRAVVTGRVQGVGFRAAARRKGAALTLAGWVRNRPDGTVETEYEGAAEALEEYERWLGSGPSFAQVEDVTVEAVPATGDAGFDVR